jgi:hypothetical protein
MVRRLSKKMGNAGEVFIGWRVQFDFPPKTPEGGSGSSTLNGNVERRVKSGNLDSCQFFGSAF